MAGLSVDNVIFGFHDNQLKVLLLECLNKKDWMLPGGFIHKEESLDEAAATVLLNRTGLKCLPAAVPRFWRSTPVAGKGCQRIL